jgi:bifunctional enzyme CysN/CysC
VRSSRGDVRAASPELAAEKVPGEAEGGVIWITGYSGAGKTTVGRNVERQLRQRGLWTVFLDGDDLRRIFSGKWGYGQAERVELAKVYFRLCSHLASQHATVVISAVAMYSDVYQWVTENIQRSLLVYLRVPDDERIRRDRATKNVYRDISKHELGYEEPASAGITIDNYGDVDPGKAAESIVNFYLAHSGDRSEAADHGKTQHWDAFYRGARGALEPSPFAVEVTRSGLKGRSRVLDVGCGNGRDSAHFAQLGHQVLAVDTSRAAIDLCRKTYQHLSIDFRHGPAEAIAASPDRPAFDVVYCRFVLHAMTEQEEAAFFHAARELLGPDGRLFLECRSIIHGHYRRFAIMDDLLQRLQAAQLKVVSKLESSHLAVFNDEDPVVIRIEARK